MSRESLIFEKLDRTHRYVESLGYNVVATFLQGSQNYNLDDSSSDYDFKCFVAPSFDRLYNRKTVSKKYELGYGQVEVKDIQLLSELLAKMNLTYVELLHTNYFMFNPKFYKDMHNIRAYKHDLAKDRLFLLSKAILGMSNEKYKNLQRPTPSTEAIIEEFGYNPKELHHIARMMHMTREFNKNKKLAFTFDDELTRNLIELKREKKDVYVVEAL